MMPRYEYLIILFSPASTGWKWKMKWFSRWWFPLQEDQFGWLPWIFYGGRATHFEACLCCQLLCLLFIFELVYTVDAYRTILPPLKVDSGSEFIILHTGFCISNGARCQDFSQYPIVPYRFQESHCPTQLWEALYCLLPVRTLGLGRFCVVNDPQIYPFPLKGEVPWVSLKLGVGGKVDSLRSFFWVSHWSRGGWFWWKFRGFWGCFLEWTFISIS